MLLVALPIDWFSPTGEALREAGAKPSIPMIVVFAVYIIFKNMRHFFQLPADGKWLIKWFSVFLLWSFLVGLLNICFIPEQFSMSPRDPVVQMINQTGMIFLFLVLCITLQVVCLEKENRLLMIALLPFAALIHFSFFLIEYFNLLSSNTQYFFQYFRNESGLIDRASGLMSEPSYYGVFAALYGVPLILIKGNNRVTKGMLGIALVTSSYIVQGKTMFASIGIQFLYIVFRSKRSMIGYFLIASIGIGITYALYLIAQTTSMFDFSENLSSAMRIGSNVLALNIVLDGYGILGIGPGQFNFYFNTSYAPDFLMGSREALDQMYGITDARASTFNYFLRILVETGLVGLLLVTASILKLFFKYINSTDPATCFGLCLVAGSLGFLMTQDTYCLPSLALGLSLLATSKSEMRNA